MTTRIAEAGEVWMDAAVAELKKVMEELDIGSITLARTNAEIVKAAADSLVAMERRNEYVYDKYFAALDLEEWVKDGDGNWRKVTVIITPKGYRVWLHDETEGTAHRNENLLPTLLEATKQTLGIWQKEVNEKFVAEQAEASDSIGEGEGSCWLT